jgi:hypothetical protein
MHEWSCSRTNNPSLYQRSDWIILGLITCHFARPFYEATAHSRSPCCRWQHNDGGASCLGTLTRAGASQKNVYVSTAGLLLPSLRLCVPIGSMGRRSRRWQITFIQYRRLLRVTVHLNTFASRPARVVSKLPALANTLDLVK